MNPGVHTEGAFEDQVELELFRHGRETVTGLFSTELGIYTGPLWEFFRRTQAKRWNKLIELYGGDPDVAQRQFASGSRPRSTRRACSTCSARA
jgi:type I restriction enzyme, R subunit